jgi:uncharacterized tellurite resistance protein B-like protein
MAPINLAEFMRIADLLMGAAYADGRLQGVELETVKELLQTKIQQELPTSAEDYLRKFNPKSFDLEACCKGLKLAGPEDRRNLLALVAKVTDADEIQDLDEGEYIRRVAALIGAQPEEYIDLAIEVISISSLEGEAPVK